MRIAVSLFLRLLLPLFTIRFFMNIQVSPRWWVIESYPFLPAPEAKKTHRGSRAAGKEGEHCTISCLFFLRLLLLIGLYFLNGAAMWWCLLLLVFVRLLLLYYGHLRGSRKGYIIYSFKN